jgi:hypothetical protein
MGKAKHWLRSQLTNSPIWIVWTHADSNPWLFTAIRSAAHSACRTENWEDYATSFNRARALVLYSGGESRTADKNHHPTGFGWHAVCGGCADLA